MSTRSFAETFVFSISLSLIFKTKRIPSGTVFARSASVTAWAAHPTFGFVRSSFVAGFTNVPHDTPAPGTFMSPSGEHAGAPNIVPVIATGTA